MKFPHYCYIVSLKYSPGLAQLFMLIGEKLQKHGWRITYLLSSDYSWLVEDRSIDVHYLTNANTHLDVLYDIANSTSSVTRKIKTLFQQKPPDFLLVYNFHPLNIIMLKSAIRASSDGIRSIYLHEPFVPDKSSYGKLASIYIILTEWLQALLLNYANCVLIPSEYSLSLFNLRYPRFKGQIRLTPILLPDEFLDVQIPRQFISLVGNLNLSRGIDEFLSLIRCSIRQGYDISFNLTTRTSVGDVIRKAPDLSRYLEINAKSKITDEEIVLTLAKSIATFLPHKQAAQSAVVPTAFRMGTPVIARNIPGLAQHVHHQENGFLFPDNANAEQLIEAVLYVIQESTRLSNQARQDFENIFSESNWERYYSWLL